MASEEARIPTSQCKLATSFFYNFVSHFILMKTASLTFKVEIIALSMEMKTNYTYLKFTQQHLVFHKTSAAH